MQTPRSLRLLLLPFSLFAFAACGGKMAAIDDGCEPPGAVAPPTTATATPEPPREQAIAAVPAPPVEEAPPEPHALETVACANLACGASCEPYETIGDMDWFCHPDHTCRMAPPVCP